VQYKNEYRKKNGGSVGAGYFKNGKQLVPECVQKIPGFVFLMSF
jgi:hypothetical protein